MSRRYISLFATTLLALILLACTSSDTTSSQPTGTPREGGTLRVAAIGTPPKVLHLYPEAQYNSTALADSLVLTWGGLIAADYDKIEYTADPRRSMAKALPEITDGGRTFTFTLRDDIKWSDGKPITSEDFQFTWEQAIKPENNYVDLDSLQRIESFATPDPKTIKVTLKQPLAPFLAMGIAASIDPLPKHIWQGKPWLDPSGNPEILKPTVVSGPYMPKEITAEGTSFVRNPNYWGERPKLDQIVFVNASPTTTLQLLSTKQVEWAQNFPPAQYADAKRIAHANVVEWSGATGSYRVVDFNLQKPVLSDKRVREALSRAINRDDLIQFEDDLAVPQYGLYPQGNTKWINDKVEKYDFDLNRSKQLLQDAGFSLNNNVLRDRNGQPVRLEIIWPTTSQPRGKMAAYLQQQWKLLGIDVTVTSLEFNAFIDRYQVKRDWDITMGSWSATLDPDSAKSQIKTNGTQNATGYSNPRVDELIELGAIEQNETRRKAIYDEIQQLVVNDLASYYMTTLKNFTAFDKKVGGVVPLKGGDILRQNNLQVIDWYISE